MKKFKLDPLLTSELRFLIMSILAVFEEVNFKYLKEKTEATGGNLSISLKKLEEAAYIKSEKGFLNKRPETRYRITALGLARLKEYLDIMDAVRKDLKEIDFSKNAESD